VCSINDEVSKSGSQTKADQVLVSEQDAKLAVDAKNEGNKLFGA